MAPIIEITKKQLKGLEKIGMDYNLLDENLYVGEDLQKIKEKEFEAYGWEKLAGENYEEIFELPIEILHLKKIGKDKIKMGNINNIGELVSHSGGDLTEKAYYFGKTLLEDVEFKLDKFSEYVGLEFYLGMDVSKYLDE